MVTCEGETLKTPEREGDNWTGAGGLTYQSAVSRLVCTARIDHHVAVADTTWMRRGGSYFRYVRGCAVRVEC